MDMSKGCNGSWGPVQGPHAKDAMDHGVLCKGPMEMLEVCLIAKLELVCLFQNICAHHGPSWLSMGGLGSTPEEPPLPEEEEEEEGWEEAPGAMEAEWEGEEDQGEEDQVRRKPKAKGKQKKKCGSKKERKRLKEKKVRKELKQKQKKDKGKKGRSSKIKEQEDSQSAAHQEKRRAKKNKPPSSSSSSSSSSSDSNEELDDPRNTSRLRRLLQRQLLQGSELLSLAGKKPMLQGGPKPVLDPQPKWGKTGARPPASWPKSTGLPQRLPPGQGVIDLDPQQKEEGEEEPKEEGKKRKKISYSPEEWTAWEEEQKKKKWRRRKLQRNKKRNGSCRARKEAKEMTRTRRWRCATLAKATHGMARSAPTQTARNTQGYGPPPRHGTHGRNLQRVMKSRRPGPRHQKSSTRGRRN